MGIETFAWRICRGAVIEMRKARVFGVGQAHVTCSVAYRSRQEAKSWVLQLKVLICFQELM